MSSVEWMFKLADRVSKPAAAIQKRLETVERTIARVEAVTRRSGGAFGGWARQGEQGARRVEQAFERVQKRLQSTHQSAQRLMQGLQGGAFVAGGLALGAGYAGKQVVDSAAYKQDQLISLKGMLGGSMDRASALFAQAQAFAAATPFTTRQILDATRQAIAIGFDDRNAVPLVDLAGKLSAGSGKSLDQVMEAFAALRGGDFGQAFGVGQGFSNLNISRQMLREAGLKFDAQGSYKGSIQEGLNAVARIINKTYGGAMAERGQSVSGLASTLASRPEELFMSLVDDRGQSRALKPLQDFMRNLADLTDFSKPPGSRIQQRFERSMAKLFGALFNPLADATGGQKGIDLIDKLLDKVDEFSAWWDRNGPGVMANLRGFGEGAKAAADGVMVLLRPLGWLVDKLSALTGGSGEGGIGKVLGFLAGGALIGKVGNILTLGGLGKVGGWAGKAALGAGRKALGGLLTRGILGEVLTNPLGKRAALGGLMRGALPALGRLGPMLLGGFGRLAPLLLGLTNPIGWIVTGVTALVTLGVVLYRKWQPFHDLVDRIWDGIKGAGRSVLDFGRNMLVSLANLWDRLPRPARLILGALIPGLGLAASAGNAIAANNPTPAPVPGLGTGGNASINALTGVARRLGIDPEHLLAVAFKESSLNPAAVNSISGASGLIQFLPSTARGLGTTAEAIRGMTPEQQAPFIERYLRQAGVGPGSTLEQVYAAVFAGNASKAGRVLYSRGSKAYADNAGLDLDRNGEITSMEAANAAASAWAGARGNFAPVINVNFNGPVTPAGVAAAQQSVGTALSNFATEGGYGATG